MFRTGTSPKADGTDADPNRSRRDTVGVEIQSAIEMHAWNMPHLLEFAVALIATLGNYDLKETQLTRSVTPMPIMRICSFLSIWTSDARLSTSRVGTPSVIRMQTFGTSGRSP